MKEEKIKSLLKRKITLLEKKKDTKKIEKITPLQKMIQDLKKDQNEFVSYEKDILQMFAQDKKVLKEEVVARFTEVIIVLKGRKNGYDFGELTKEEENLLKSIITYFEKIRDQEELKKKKEEESQKKAVLQSLEFYQKMFEKIEKEEPFKEEVKNLCKLEVEPLSLEEYQEFLFFAFAWNEKIYQDIENQKGLLEY